MQEEVTQKTIALSVKTARVTADVLKNMLRKYLSGQKQKGKNPYKVGKQSYKELKSQGSGLSNIEITDGNIKSFERVAKKYRLDFALKKDSSTKPPTYYVFFKGQDTEMMNLAFKKYLGVQMNKKDKPSIMKKLMHFKDAVSKGKNRERAREQQFKKAVAPSRTGSGPNGIAKHKCAICGRTEKDDPNLEFRFCSKCNGNYEYCQDHLFTHKHVQ